MNYIKRFVLFILCCLTILPVNVNATGGALKKVPLKLVQMGLHTDFIAMERGEHIGMLP